MWQDDLRELREHRHHLVAYVTGLKEPLLDEPLQRTDHKSDIWYHYSAELWTPMSFPLRLRLALFYNTGFEVWSADTKLLQLDSPDRWMSVRLWLPTDEFLDVTIVSQQRYDRR